MRLGWLWWFLEPFLFTMIYLFIFSFVFRSNIPYAIPYIAIGQAVWDFFSRTCTNSVTIIRHYRGLLTRSDIPKFALLNNTILISGFKMLISFLVAFVMMFYYHVPVAWTWILFPAVLLVLIVFSFGCGLWLLHLGVYIADLKNILPVVLRVMFFLSGIFYSLEDRMGELASRMILRYNPVGCLIFEIRNVLLYHRLYSVSTLAAWLMAGIFLTVTGLKLIERHEKDYIKVI